MDIGTRKKGVWMYPGGNLKISYKEGEGGGTRYLFFIDHIASKRNLFILNYTQTLRIVLCTQCCIVLW